MNSEEKKGISEVVTLGALNEHSFSVPVYQRPYTWGNIQVQALLEDLHKAFTDRVDSPYLLGTIILHLPNKSEQTSEIVDGQQRLTTLSLLLLALGDLHAPIAKLPDHQDSKRAVYKNYHQIKAWVSIKFEAADLSDFIDYLKDKITFLKVLVDNPDDAFTFFDSQNTRGKALAREDLLKAHHLRFMDMDNEQVAKACVEAWERLDKIVESGLPRLKWLLHTLLGRARLYARNEFKSLDVLDEFRSQVYGSRKDSGFHLNFYQQPPVFESWHYSYTDQRGRSERSLKLSFRDKAVMQSADVLEITENALRFIPFQITQALEGGEQLFWFVQKYDELAKRLFSNEILNEHCFLKSIRSAHDSFSGGIDYLKDAFDAALLFYFDKFGANHLEQAAVCFEHFFFMARLEQYSVRSTTVKKFLENANSNEMRCNPFFLIDRASCPEYIFDRMNKFFDADCSRSLAVIVESINEGQSKKYWQALYGSEDSLYGASHLAETDGFGYIIKIKKKIGELNVGVEAGQ